MIITIDLMGNDEETFERDLDKTESSSRERELLLTSVAELALQIVQPSPKHHR